jgi:hypothetical protein
MTVEEAKTLIDTLAAQTRMTRQDHALVMEALGLLYSGAKENQEKKPVSPGT